MLTWSAIRPEKYVISVFLDITGAFDNLAWPALQTDLHDLGVTRHLRKWIENYLSGRTASMTIGGVVKTVAVTKGCPQGSILGPILWNVTMEALLRLDFPEHVAIQAYADDIAISIAGQTRAAIIQRTEEALIPVLEWAADRGLSFSATKSQAMMTKGDLVPGFTVSFGEDRITSYRGVFLPKIAYGVRFWSHALSASVVERKMATLQRRALVGITGAYRSTSTAALQVLAGIPPLDLELIWLAAKDEAKLLPEINRIETMKSATTKMMDAWTSTQKGRWTHECFPDIRGHVAHIPGT